MRRARKSKFKVLRGGDVLQFNSSDGAIGAAASTKPLQFVQEEVDITQAKRSPQQRDLVHKVPFNVLPIQATISPLFASPLLVEFLRTCREALDLLRPITRLGIPETSIRNKCPYWRPDNSYVEAAFPHHVRIVCRAHEDGSLYLPVHTHIPPPRFYTHPMNAFHVCCVNCFALWWICTKAAGV